MRFLLVCEGSLDTALLPHIQRLLTRYGYPDSPGEAWSDGRRLVDKVRNGLQRLGQFDLLFVHRDADNAEQIQDTMKSKMLYKRRNIAGLG